MADTASFLDWLAFTLPYNPESWGWIERQFGPWRETGRGLKGYSNTGALAGGGIVAWTPGRHTNRIYIVQSAQALSHYGQSAGARSPRDLLAALRMAGGRVTRLDCALDDLTGALSLRAVAFACLSGDLVSRFKAVDIRASFPIADAASAGITVYLGSRTSESFVRMYDKRQQMAKLWPDVESLPECWNRVEFEFKGEKADLIAARIVDGSFDFPALLLRYVQFKAREAGESRRERWPLAQWWTDFLRCDEPAAVTWPRYRVGLDQLRGWLERQAAPALSTIADIYGDAEIGRLLIEGAKRAAEIPRYSDMKRRYGGMRRDRLRESARAEHKAAKA